MWNKEQMAQAVINIFAPHSSVNLGIGMPTMLAEMIDPKLSLMIHAENGILGVGDRPSSTQVSPTLINAGKETITINPGASFFDSAISFGMIRGGHLDYCVLGGMEVDVEGSLANWMIPGKKITGMGGAMDLVNGAKQVIIMMNHCSKEGVSKLTAKCQLPLTGHRVVHLVVTEYGIFRPTGTKFIIEQLATEGSANALPAAELFE